MGAKRSCATLICLVLICSPAFGQAAIVAPDRSLKGILDYINRSWTTLTRSLDNCATLIDPKVPDRSVLYLPAGMPIPSRLQELGTKCNVRVQNLPRRIARLGEFDVNVLKDHGLLFLEHPYVVPGGRFNEMYGWDSFFIILGLLRDGRIDLARGMVDNFLFEIEHYGAVLNANRTYFLTRSQPPFLTSMILALYEVEKKSGREDREWLARAYAGAEKDYQLWTREPHLVADTGLSRYYDFGQGPVPEEMATYTEVLESFLRAVDTRYIEAKNAMNAGGPGFTLFACDEQTAPPATKCKRLQTVGLKSEYYKGDRSMRESGFDISFRFGPYGADTHRYVPVCLNSLLYKTEKDMERISNLLRLADDAQRWRARAQSRQQLMNKYLWDEHRGMFFDYNFEAQKRSTYEYATTFYPLWAGLATPEQARAVVRNLPTFEQVGGLAISPYQTRVQWDYPYGWAPIQLLAAQGLRDYGFQEQANRISYQWLSTVHVNFVKDGTIREKYNVVTRSSETPVAAGYKANVVGFGWTNGVFLELLHALPREWADRIGQTQPSTTLPPR
ncbi:MAG TPA: trehalase family glycosidase [Terriglobales bacterium]|nr:trehalase family glycosidase [Terriglobales bacterium]